MENMKNQINAIMHLKDRLRKEKDTLVGLEYLIFMRDAKTNPFTCYLCDKSGDYYNIIQHIKSSVHKVKYLVRKSASTLWITTFFLFFPANKLFAIHVIAAKHSAMLSREELDN